MPHERLYLHRGLDFTLPPTDRQLEILQKMANGYSLKEIASELEISVNTVKIHLYAQSERDGDSGLFERLGVKTSPHAVAEGFRQELIE